MKHDVKAKTEQSILESQLSATSVHVYSSNKSHFCVTQLFLEGASGCFIQVTLSIQVSKKS